MGELGQLSGFLRRLYDWLRPEGLPAGLCRMLAISLQSEMAQFCAHPPCTKPPGRARPRRTAGYVDATSGISARSLAELFASNCLSGRDRPRPHHSLLRIKKRALWQSPGAEHSQLSHFLRFSKQDFGRAVVEWIRGQGSSRTDPLATLLLSSADRAVSAMAARMVQERVVVLLAT